jgi:hypothetical protein
MKRTSRILALVAALFAASPSAAHEQGDRAMGVVESVTADRIVIKAADGHSVAFTVTPETRFFQDEKPARPEDVRVGQRAVVHGKRDGERIQAERVRLSAMKSSK